MRLVLFLLLLIPSFVKAQESKVMDLNTCTKFYQDKIKEINGEIYQGVIEGKLTAYDVDSFKTILHKDTIALHKWSWYEEAVYDTIKKAIKYGCQFEDSSKFDSGFNVLHYETLKRNFNPKFDFEGINFITENTFDTNSFAITQKITFLSPSYPLIIEGQYLYPQPAFSLKIKDIQNYLDQKTFSFLKSLLLRRISIFEFEGNYNYKSKIRTSKNSDALNNISSSYDNAKYTNIGLYGKMDTIISEYYISLASYMAANLQLSNKIIYKDVKLTKPYHSIKKELGLNTEMNFDCYNATFFSPFSFRDMPFYIIKDINDYTICLRHKYTDETEYKLICYSYSSAKHYLKPFDQIILESLFEEMLKENK